MKYQGFNWRAIFLILVILLVIIGIVWWLNHETFITGQSVAVDEHPYNQLAYTKLSEQGGNFVGDIYLLDVDSHDITQLTQGGETSVVAWFSSQTLDFIQRPRGSVVNPYHLNVNRGTASPAILPLTDDISIVERSSDGQRIVTQILGDDWEALGYTIIEIEADDSETLLTITDASNLPVWLHDNQTILYPTQDNQICLHDVIDDSRECLSGTQPALSPSVTPVLVAYTNQINDIYQLCVAHIDNQAFSHTECYDQHPDQISNLLWRP